MSADLRLKKLRGSGGYIMANVDDNQQRKGNLGGPDLFLAPIGRISADKISKYFCNTCERDYEGSPNIEYENPNEEVADNLILVEKGQYACTTCGSTLAEYREFKKPDELSEVGAAKPLDASFGTEFDTPSFTAPQSFEPQQQVPSVPNFDFQTNMQSPSQDQPQTQSQPSSISSIVGMSVFDQNAKRIGTAKQVGIDSSQSLVLVITRTDGSEATVPWSQIKKVGEIVLLGGQETPTQSASSQVQDSKCSNCGFSNKVGSKFCEECGTKI